MMNPFALFLYLEPVRKDLKTGQFLKVIFKASLISLIICLLFFFGGNLIFDTILQIDFESFRIFGGIIIFSFAYHFIVKGQKALIIMKEDLDDLASEIALPFMVGAGTLSLSILLSQKSTSMVGAVTLIIVFVINYIILMLMTYFREHIAKKKIRIAFDKNMEVMLRLNGFFIGAIGVDMIITGIMNMGII